MGRRGYAAEFRRGAVELIKAGKLGIGEQTLHTWRCQSRIDKALEAGLTFGEHAQLVAARRRIRDLAQSL